MAHEGHATNQEAISVYNSRNLSDFFFSGHTAIAVYGAVEVARLGRVRWIVAAWIIALFQVAAVIALRAHWTMDVFGGAVTALLIAQVAAWLAPSVDRRLAAFGGVDRRH